jgi:hypothetical protein
MAVNLYSNCSIITTGCFFYNDSNQTTPVSNGKYSDGTNCYTVDYGNGYVTTVGTCSYAGDVYFTAGGEQTFDESGDYNWIMYASSTANSYGANPVVITTTVSMDVTVYTEYDYYYPSGAISSGFSCSPNFYADGVYPYQVVISISPTSVTPTSNGGQNYYTSTGDLGPYIC